MPIIAALVDGKLRELTYPIARDATVEPIDLSQSDGERIYRRSLTFPDGRGCAPHLPGSPDLRRPLAPFAWYFCEVGDRAPFTDEELTRLVSRCVTLSRLISPFAARTTCRLMPPLRLPAPQPAR